MYVYKEAEFTRIEDYLDPAIRDAVPLQLAVIVPTFNEHDNIPLLVQRLRHVLQGLHWEAVFVDDNSPDDTSGAVAKIAATDPRIRLVHRIGRRGLSSAVVEGMLATVAPVVAVIDGDLQHDESVLVSLFEAVASGECDLAVGTRYCDGGSIGSWDKSRAAVSQAGTRLAKLVLGTQLNDPMSGFFAVRRDALIAAVPGLSSIGYKILLDIVASSPVPLRIREIPYTFRERVNGASKLDSAILIEFAILLFDKLVGRWLPPRFVMFLAVGALGLLVHLAILGLALNVLGTSFIFAQTTAVIVSMTGNYFLNNQLTYRDRRRTGFAFVTGLISFYLICGLGALANVGIGNLIYGGGQRWWIAGVIGAAIGSVWNYAASSCLTWRRS